MPNNYASISFNVGPTLLSWLQVHSPKVYQAILRADRESQARFSGHGSALAQVYNHMILPLAGSRDKRTQVLWGVRDFEHRFGRRPEGMWLPETAVDLESLELLAQAGVRFTILEPGQAARVRRIGAKEWRDVSGGRIDPKMPYLCRLPGGARIALFFYDGPISRDLGFGDVLSNGELFAGRLLSAFTEGPEEAQLVHIATDGETYGHHRPHGDMALAYCLHHLESQGLAAITVYGEYLERHPPSHEVQIFENTSWSCAHGVERWRSDCGCSSGMHAGWQQRWRKPLREALDWLRDALAPLYEMEAGRHLRDPWEARDRYIEVVLDRSPDSVERFLAESCSAPLDPQGKVRVLKLLELQRHAMLMYTSCGWFFDEISGIETTQVIQYAARAIQLARETLGVDLEESFVHRLQDAPSNIPELGDGARVYEQLVLPSRITLLEVGAHYAVSSLFEDYPEETGIYCYQADRMGQDRVEAGKVAVAFGRVRMRSQVTLEEGKYSYAILHLGDHMINGGIRPYGGQASYGAMHDGIREVFLRSDIPEVIRLMDDHFGGHSYSLWNLFRDEQRKIFRVIMQGKMDTIERDFRRIVEDNYAVAQAMAAMKIRLPKALAAAIEHVLNADLGKLVEQDPVDGEALERVAAEIRKWSVPLDRTALSFAAAGRVDGLMRQFASDPEEVGLLEQAETLLSHLDGLSLEVNLREAQNLYHGVARGAAQVMAERAGRGEEPAEEWLAVFRRLGERLRVRSG